MKCNICDKTMKPEEIQWDVRYNEWDPCAVCLRVISETFGEEGDEKKETEVEEDFDDEIYHGDNIFNEINVLENTS